MKRLLQVLIGLALVLGAAASGVWYFRSVERETLDETTRAAAPGRFVGSSVGFTHYETAGPDTGRVAVLVHGFSVPAYIWDSTFTSLAAAGYRVIRYDLLGRGWSERSDVAYDGETFDAQLVELLDSLRVTGPVDLFGLSFGGFVASQFAARHPTRVRTLVLVDPVVNASRGPWYTRAPVLGRYVIEVLAVPGMAEGQPGDFLHPERFPGWADRYRPQMRYRGFGRAVHRSRFESAHVDFEELHGTIQRQGTPLLLVWGRQDKVLDISLAEDVKRRIPSLEFVPIDSAGHLPHLEQTAAFNAAVLAFLTRHGPTMESPPAF